MRSCQLEVIKKKKIKLWTNEYLVHNTLKRQLLDAMQYTSLSHYKQYIITTMKYS